MLNQLSDNKGARKERNRVGRGIGSGNGKTSGRGQKGQKARSGGSIMPGFEGGQNPLYRRLPIRGFSNFRFTKHFAQVNVGDLQKFADSGKLDASKAITLDVLKAAGVVRKSETALKVLGNGDVKSKFTIETTAASKSAVEKIEKAGGKVTVTGSTLNKFLPTSAKNKAEAKQA